ncbi:ABC transporter substrate-binding protein [Nesterenkonia alba]|uniref:ABC transporter substrate-binding protein n=1 Tax=Nesterenkonia alba TaxID=515814 RepID=UPI0003FF6F73|nr:ABC transporter substrate-binding protein [Nesterenkonia alba]
MRKYTAFATGAIGALMLSACGGDGTPDGANGANGAGQQEGGGEFNIAWNAQPPTLDPLVTTSTATRDISRNFFEPLITIDADGEVQTVLAEDYEVSDDGLEITFTLREGVQFHDGSTMEADDVVASLEGWIERSGAGQTFFSEAEVSSEDADTVTVTLPEPMYIAVELLADQSQLPVIMPAEIIEEAPEEGVEEYVGTGPYELTEWSTDQYIQLDRFEEYESPEGETHGTAGEKDPYYDTIYYHIVTDSSTRVSGLQSGEYDAANALPLDNVDMLESNEDIELVSGEQGFNGAVFNKQEGLMADVTMRQAVLAAVDAEELQQSAFVSEEFYNTNGALMPEDSDWYSDAGQELFHNDDPAVAEELLEEAGYDGETITILTTREYDDHYNAAVPLQQQLENAGMNVELNVTDWATVLQDRTDPEAYDIFITGFAPVTVPVTYVFLYDNWPGWTDSEDIAAALDAISTAEGEEQALEAAEDLQQAFYDYLPMVKFGDKYTVTGMQDWVAGYEYVALSGDIFYNVRPAE